MKIYVASSWRNPHQHEVVKFLRSLEHEVYDFKSPEAGNNGFHWSEIDGGWQQWNAHRFREALKHPVADRGFKFDMDALHACDACVLVLPCGRSAHLELGWAAGAGKRTIVYLAGENEPELMYKMCSAIVLSMPEIQTALFDGHSMGRYLPCMACGDIDGCHRWATGGNQFESRKYERPV